MEEIKLDSVKKSFVNYLDSLGLSSKSHKNYRSDLNHFTSWAIMKIRSFGSYVENLTEVVPFLNLAMAEEYKNYLLDNKTSTKTINRRLSTLRHFGRHLIASQLIDFDFTQSVTNISQRKETQVLESSLVTDFRSYLEQGKASKNTIKNYVSDVKQFLDWLEKNNQNTSKSI